MPEPTLALTYGDIRIELGVFFGHALDPDEWNDEEAASVQRCMTSGLRQFYHPPPVEGRPPHAWSFLKPITSLTLAATKSTVALPGDYGGLEGQITVSASGVRAWPLTTCNWAQIAQRHVDLPDSTGRPVMVGVQAMKGTTAKEGQRSQLYFWPTADQQYTLQVPYYVNERYLDEAFPYHMGGAQHSETVLASCLAAAELKVDDQRGPRWAYFLERLAASIDADRHQHPQTVGLNLDRSDRRADLTRLRSFSQVTFNGVAY